MAKILCMTSGLTGILNASFELVNRLEVLGHKVVSASPKTVGEKVRAQGFTYLQLDPINFDPAPSVPDYSGPTKKVKRLVHKLSHVKSRRQKAIDALGMENFLDKIKDARPQLVIVDIELHEHIMTLVSSGFNVLLLSQWFSTWDSPGLPSIQSETIPGNGFSGSKLGMRLNWMVVRRERWFIFFKKKLNTVYTDRRSILQAYAEKTGFHSYYIQKNYWPGPFTYDRLPVISMTAEGLDFPHDKRPALTYLGPMVYEGRKEPNAGPDAEGQLKGLWNEKQKNGTRLIYCSVSTFKAGDTAFLKRVITAAEGLPDYILIISLGGMLGSSEFEKLPSNVYAFEKVPQLDVLKHADLSINHGGIHTINECIHFGVPMLVYSGKRSDQNGCAARVQHHGIGIMADKDLDTPEDIKRKIEQTLNASSIRNRLAKAQKEYPTGDTSRLSVVLKGLGTELSEKNIEKA